MLGIRGFTVAESLQLHNTGEKLRIVLLGQSCGVQITKRRFSAPLRGTLFAPTAVFRSDVGNRQSDSAHNYRDQDNIKTHSLTLQRNSQQHCDRRGDHPIDCKVLLVTS
jgi:hypothetical protein